MYITSRTLMIIGTIICLFSIFFGFYLQFELLIEPCPLCISQRITLMLIAFFGFIAFIHNPPQYRYRIYGFIYSTISLLGIYLAGRQIWLQSLPLDDTPKCLLGFESLKKILPISDLVKLMLTGSANCNESSYWVFLKLNIPQWSLLIFVILLLIGINTTKKH